jgi:hypothetical protein
MFANPIFPKNPYNNMPFSTAILYHIYFFMKKGNFVLSSMFHQFFLCNFNLVRFKNENAVIIRKKYIDQYMKDSDNDELFEEGLHMLQSNKYTRKMKIDKEFPVDKFVEIMRPYLYIYYIQLYTLDLSEKNCAANELNILLKHFYKYNPRFGRKYVKHNSNGQNDVFFNDIYIKFEYKKYNNIASILRSSSILYDLGNIVGRSLGDENNGNGGSAIVDDNADDEHVEQEDYYDDV